MKVCLACSGGGHFAELMQLKAAWKGLDVFFLTDERENTRTLKERERVYFVECPRRSAAKFLKNAWQAWRALRVEKPDVVVSTGADTAFAACLLGKLLGAKLVFLESFTRVRSPSLTGKLLYPIADTFFVQWPDLCGKLKKAVYRGAVI